MIATVKLINIPITSQLPFVCVIRTLKIYPAQISSVQFNMLTIVTILHISSPELIPLTIESAYPSTNRGLMVQVSIYRTPHICPFCSHHPLFLMDHLPLHIKCFSTIYQKTNNQKPPWKAITETY